MRHRVYKDDILTVVVEYVNVGAMTNNNIWEAQVKTCHIRIYRTCCLKLISKLLGIPLRCTHQISIFSFNHKEVLSRTFFCIFWTYKSDVFGVSCIAPVQACKCQKMPIM